MVNFKEIYLFSRFQSGSNIFQGGPTFFQGESNCLFPIETHITCDVPPLDPHLLINKSTLCLLVLSPHNMNFVNRLDLDQAGKMLGLVWSSILKEKK